MKKRGRKTATNLMGNGGSQMDNHNGNEDVDDTEAEEEDEEEDKEEDKSEDEVKEGYVHTSSQHGLSKNLANTSGPTKRARSGNNTLDAGANADK